MSSLVTEVRPNPGPQELLLSCPVEDVFFGGARWGGKTYGVLLDFAQHAELYGKAARGILFRRSYPELEEVERIAYEILGPAGWQYRLARRMWVAPNGATLRLRFLANDGDEQNYQGHSYSWMCFDEVTNWPTPMMIDMLWACVRSAEGIPCFRRVTGNPGGPGHNWVKARYIDPSPALVPFRQEFTSPLGGHTYYIDTVFIPSRLEDNPAAMMNDPNYEARVMASGPDWLVRAWRYGDWDIVAGGMFDDVWRRAVHVIPPFAIPATWFIDRSFDWGSSHPFACCWWAESDGTDFIDGTGHRRRVPRGTLFLIAEYYGWNGRPNQGCKLVSEEIARGIIDREIEWGLTEYVNPGPADPSIFGGEGDDSASTIAGRMELASLGLLLWERAENKPGSRINGWERVRTMLKEALKPVPEEPCLYLFNTCPHAVRTLPVLQRDTLKVTDIAKGQEDHEPDAIRYRCAFPGDRVYAFRPGVL